MGISATKNRDTTKRNPESKSRKGSARPSKLATKTTRPDKPALQGRKR